MFFEWAIIEMYKVYLQIHGLGSDVPQKPLYCQASTRFNLTPKTFHDSTFFFFFFLLLLSFFFSFRFLHPETHFKSHSCPLHLINSLISTFSALTLKLSVPFSLPISYSNCSMHSSLKTERRKKKKKTMSLHKFLLISWWTSILKFI